VEEKICNGHCSSCRNQRENCQLFISVTLAPRTYSHTHTRRERIRENQSQEEIETLCVRVSVGKEDEEEGRERERQHTITVVCFDYKCLFTERAREEKP
jgi:hypothetical protein